MTDLVAEIDQQIESLGVRLWHGDYDHDVEQALQDAHERAASLNHLPLQTQALRLMGSLAYLVMNLEQARLYINKAQALALRLKDTAQMLSLGANLGFLHRAQGDPQAAIRHFQPFVDKLDLVEIKPGLVRPATTVLLRYIVCLVLAHEYDEAERRLGQAQALMAQYDSSRHPDEAAGLRAYLAFSRASVYMERGDFERAREQCDAFERANRDLGRPADVVMTNLLYMRLDVLTDQPPEQQEMAWRNMLVTVQPFLARPPQKTVLHHIAQYGFLEEADYYAVHGKPQWARRCAEQALAIFQRIEHQEMIARTQAILAGLDEGGTS